MHLGKKSYVFTWNFIDSKYPDWLTHCSHPGIVALGAEVSRTPWGREGGREQQGRWTGVQPVPAPPMKQNTIFTQSFFELQ